MKPRFPHSHRARRERQRQKQKGRSKNERERPDGRPSITPEPPAQDNINREIPTPQFLIVANPQF